MSTKKIKSVLTSTLKRTHKEEYLRKKVHSSLFHLSACAFHNSRLNFVLYLGNKIIVNIKKLVKLLVVCVEKLTQIVMNQKIFHITLPSGHTSAL